MVTSHDEHVGLRSDQGRETGIGFFDGFHFGVEVAVFTGSVSRLDMDKNVVESFERFDSHRKFFG